MPNLGSANASKQFLSVNAQTVKADRKKRVGLAFYCSEACESYASESFSDDEDEQILDSDFFG